MKLYGKVYEREPFKLYGRWHAVVQRTGNGWRASLLEPVTFRDVGTLREAQAGVLFLERLVRC